jgi:hypothetical protein
MLYVMLMVELIFFNIPNKYLGIAIIFLVKIMWRLNRYDLINLIGPNII